MGIMSLRKLLGHIVSEGVLVKLRNAVFQNMFGWPINAVLLFCLMFNQLAPPAQAQKNLPILETRLRPPAAKPSLEKPYLAQLLQADDKIAVPSATPVEEPPPHKGKSHKRKDETKDTRKYADTTPCLSWMDPDKEPKSVILCVHGLGLHKGTYAQFGEAMAKQGYAIYSVDVRGFGEFQGAPGRRKVDFEGCLKDVYKTLRVIHRIHPGKAIFILGESMGGAIALRITSLYPAQVDGLISSVPAGDRFNQTKEALRVGLKVITGGFNKEFDVGSGVIARATQKPELQEQWSKDPMARLNLSPAELIQFQQFMDDNKESARNITQVPVLMVQGVDDKLVKPEGTKALFEALAVPDREMIFIQNAEHLIFEEGQFDNSVIETICDWIDKHANAKVTPQTTPSSSTSP